MLARRRARLAEQGQRISSAAAASERARFWFAVKTAVACILGGVAGLLPMAWALHTTDVESAKIAWHLGPIIGSTCIVVTLILASIKWERDDW